MKLLLFLWCLPQNLLAIIIKLTLRCKSEKYHGINVCRIKSDYCFSLGEYVFISEDIPIDSRLILHELGHTVQSRIFGPLYLLIVALPSVIWCRFFEKYRKRKSVSYYAFIVESSANRLSAKHFSAPDKSRRC